MEVKRLSSRRAFSWLGLLRQPVTRTKQKTIVRIGIFNPEKVVDLIIKGKFWVFWVLSEGLSYIVS